MRYSDLIKHYGTVAEAAKKLGFTRAAIYYWRNNTIPKRTQGLIESLTGGKLKAGK